MTDGQTDRQTDGQNYDSQDRASIAASRGKQIKLGKLNARSAFALPLRSTSVAFSVPIGWGNFGL